MSDKRTVEWICIDGSGQERAAQQLQRIELYERRRRIRASGQRSPNNRHAALADITAQSLVTLLLLLIAASITAYSNANITK